MKKIERHGFRMPDWLGEEWVWEAFLVVLVTGAVINAIMSIGTGVTV